MIMTHSHSRVNHFLRLEKYTTKGLKVCDEIGKLIDEVPLRHKDREEAKIAEENEKRRQEELRRKQQGIFVRKVLKILKKFINIFLN